VLDGLCKDRLNLMYIADITRQKSYEEVRHSLPFHRRGESVYYDISLSASSGNSRTCLVSIYSCKAA
jgi:hypothetical protein